MSRPIIQTCVDILSAYQEGRIISFAAENQKEAEMLRKLLIITFSMTADKDIQEYDPETRPILFAWDEEEKLAKLQLPLKEGTMVPAAAMKTNLQQLLQNILDFNDATPEHATAKPDEKFTPCHNAEEAELVRKILAALAASHDSERSEQDILQSLFVRGGSENSPPGVVIPLEILGIICDEEGRSMPKCSIR